MLSADIHNAYAVPFESLKNGKKKILSDTFPHRYRVIFINLPRPVLHLRRSMSHKLLTRIFPRPSVIQKSPARFEQTRLSQSFRQNDKLTISYPGKKRMAVNFHEIFIIVIQTKNDDIFTIYWILAIVYAHYTAVAKFSIPIGFVAAANWIVDSRTYIGTTICLIKVILRWITPIAFSAVSQTII